MSSKVELGLVKALEDDAIYAVNEVVDVFSLMLKHLKGDKVAKAAKKKKKVAKKKVAKKKVAKKKVATKKKKRTYKRKA